MSSFTESRRDFLLRSLICGTAAVIYDTFGASSLLAETTWTDSQAELEEHLRIMNNNLAQVPAEMQDYLRHSEIVQATSHTQDTFHETFSNSWQVEHRESKSFVTPTDFTQEKGDPWIGIDRDPWSWVAHEFRPNLTLNNLEIAVLKQSNTALSELAMWKDERLVIAPFPDSGRFVPEQPHVDAFAALFRRNNLDPDQRNLKYVRYFVAGSRKGTTEMLKIKLITAFGHSRRGGNPKSTLKLDYTVQYA